MGFPLYFDNYCLLGFRYRSGDGSLVDSFSLQEFYWVWQIKRLLRKEIFPALDCWLQIHLSYLEKESASRHLNRNGENHS